MSNVVLISYKLILALFFLFLFPDLCNFRCFAGGGSGVGDKHKKLTIMRLGSRAVLCTRLTPADTEVGPSFAVFWILTPEI